MRARLPAWCLFVVWLTTTVGCGTAETADSGLADAGVSGDFGSRDAAMDGGGVTCTGTMECDDGLFCNGAEVCTAGACRAASSAPCAPPMGCSESTDRCVSQCVDVDGDGACVPDDCDDGNDRAFPGATERCDPMNVDEDCNPATYGPVDADGDMFNSASCCNMGAGGLACGDDCDDAAASANPAAPEVCDPRNADNDCNPGTPSPAPLRCWEDLDGDGYALTTAAMTMACTCPTGTTAREPIRTPNLVERSDDCNDDPASGGRGIFPRASEVCSSPVDDNCDGMVNEQCGACVAGQSRRCSGLGLCSTGTETCQTPAFVWGPCSIQPTAGEVCTQADFAQDDDCDGQNDRDEGLVVVCYRDEDGDTYAAAGATASDRCRDATRVSAGQCPTGYTFRAPTPGATDCLDTDARYRPDQSGFFYNPVRRCLSTNCPTPPCACVDRDDWDFDCNGLTTPEPAFTSATATCGGRCNVANNCFTKAIYTGSPACGTQVLTQPCSCGATTCSTGARVNNALRCH